VLITSVAFELRFVIDDLRRGTQSARAVALVKRLLTDADSVLYGDDPAELRAALDRIGFLIGSPQHR
jgi:hypothetical protein